MSLVNKNTKLSAEAKRTLENYADTTSLATALKQYKKSLDEHSLSKGIRPWQLVDVTAHLDPTQPWVGLEWENGFKSKADYQRVVDFAWVEVDNFVIDAEGPGPWYGEFTFAPVNLESLMRRDTGFDTVLNYMVENDLRMPTSCEEVNTAGLPHGWDDDDDVDGIRYGWGIHANISTPLTRSITSEPHMHFTCWLMNKAIGEFSGSQNEQLFGRDPYGLSYMHQLPDGGCMYEFKLFQTTDDPAVIDSYRAVIAKLPQVIDLVYTHVASQDLNVVRTRFGTRVEISYPTVRSMFEFLNGTRDTLEYRRDMHQFSAYWGYTAGDTIKAVL